MTMRAMKAMKTSATKARKHSCPQLQRDQTEQCQCILMSMEKLKQKLPSQHKINPGIMADAKSMPLKEMTDKMLKSCEGSREAGYAYSGMSWTQERHKNGHSGLRVEIVQVLNPLKSYCATNINKSS